MPDPVARLLADPSRRPTSWVVRIPWARRHRSDRLLDQVRFLGRVERALRTGMTVRHAIAGGVAESAPWIRSTFGPALDDGPRDRPFDVELASVAASVAEPDLRQAATVLSLIASNEHGAADVVAVAAHACDVARRLDQERQALVAQAQLSAVILAALPLIVVVASAVFGGAAAARLFGTTAGRWCLVGGAVLEAVAFGWMSLLIRRAGR